MEREVIFNEELSCSFHTIEVFPEKDKLIQFRGQGVPNMSSCIELSKRLYPEVPMIVCHDEQLGRTTAYFLKNGNWEARSVR